MKQREWLEKEAVVDLRNLGDGCTLRIAERNFC